VRCKDQASRAYGQWDRLRLRREVDGQSDRAAAHRQPALRFLESHFDVREVGVCEVGRRPAQGDEAPVEVEHRGVRLALGLAPVEPGALEGLGRLRVRHLLRGPAERLELAPAAARDGGAKVRVGVVCEVLKRCAGGPLLAHEEQWHGGRRQHAHRRDLRSVEAREVRETLAEGAVADLVVVLREGDEVVRRHVRRRASVAAAAVARVAAVIDVDVA
jgi:hypothetical protein